MIGQRPAHVRGTAKDHEEEEEPGVLSTLKILGLCLSENTVYLQGILKKVSMLEKYNTFQVQGLSNALSLNDYTKAALSTATVRLHGLIPKVPGHCSSCQDGCTLDILPVDKPNGDTFRVF